MRSGSASFLASLSAGFAFHLAVVDAATPPVVSVPKGGKELVFADSAQPVLPKEPGIATAQKQPVDAAPWASIWHFEITRPAASSWSVQLHAKIPGGIHKNDKCLLFFYARNATASPSAPKAGGSANVEISAPPYSKVGQSDFRVGAQWEPVVVPFVSSAEVPEGKGGVAIHLGGQLQQIEIGGLRLLNFGADFPFEKLPHPLITYEGREPDAAWRKAALARIEKNRKGDFTIQVVDSKSQPIANAQIHAVLKRHAFGFGSAVTAKWLNDPSEDGKKYRAIVEENFSRVVLENDLKHFAWETYKDPKTVNANFRKEWLDGALKWLDEQQISVRGHYLCWAPWEDWSRKLKDQPEVLRETIFEQIREELPAIGNRVTEWDALNHPAAWERSICIDTVLGQKFYSEVFWEARKHTKLPLWINEDQVFRPGRQQEEYYQIIKDMIAAGAKPDGIGNQAHFHSSFLPSPEDMLKNSDRFAALVPALRSLSST
jgi:GH35 family endo-1,4-beta-xylanase